MTTAKALREYCTANKLYAAAMAEYKKTWALLANAPMPEYAALRSAYEKASAAVDRARANCELCAARLA